jgi:hypothetical protein
VRHRFCCRTYSFGLGLFQTPPQTEGAKKMPELMHREVAYQAQHLHDGTWWATGSMHNEENAAIAAAKKTGSEHCNGMKIRVVQIVTETTTMCIWQKEL